MWESRDQMGLPSTKRPAEILWHPSIQQKAFFLHLVCLCRSHWPNHWKHLHFSAGRGKWAYLSFINSHKSGNTRLWIRWFYKDFMKMTKHFFSTSVLHLNGWCQISDSFQILTPDLILGLVFFEALFPCFYFTNLQKKKESWNSDTPTHWSVLGHYEVSLPDVLIVSIYHQQKTFKLHSYHV